MMQHIQSRFWFIIVAVIVSLLWLGGTELSNQLAFHRLLIIEGEFWRLISGHLVHSNTWHYLLNLASLTMIALLFGSLMSNINWSFAFLFCALFVSGCYLVLAPQYTSYVGLSAVLYGVIIVGALLDLKDNKLVAIILLLVVTGRVIWQQFDGPSEELAELVNNRVAVESHLFGIISGYLFGLYKLFSLNNDTDPSDLSQLPPTESD